MTPSDFELLQEYANSHSEKAFASLVARHLNLVYSAALRQVHSSQLAEDITQSVFLDLSRNAKKLKPDTLVSAWLFQTTRRTAINIWRQESRRLLREKIAVDLADMNSPNPEWKQIEPLLDEAMESLAYEDRDALLLRFFENKSLREVGENFGASENAAQKRVSRAIEQLRTFFVKRGVAVGGVSLLALLSTHVVQAAPVGLGAAISSALSVATISQTSVAAKSLLMTTTQKVIIVTAVVAFVGAGIYQAIQNHGLRQQIQQLQQQQKPLVEQNEQNRFNHNEATKRLALLQQENEKLRSDEIEIHKLRADAARLKHDSQELAQLKAVENADPLQQKMKLWLTRANQLKQYLEDNPQERIPEHQFLTESDWNKIGESLPQKPLHETPDDDQKAMDALRFEAGERFAWRVRVALTEYFRKPNKQFPTDLSQLQPYCDPAEATTLLQLYEIAPASIVKDNTPGEGYAISSFPQEVDGDWIITRKERLVPTSTTRIAISKNGTAYWQSTR